MRCLVLALLLVFLACSCPLDPEPQCRQVLELVVDDGSLAQLHAYQDEHPGASCNTVTVVFDSTGDMTATYQCERQECGVPRP